METPKMMSPETRDGHHREWELSLSTAFPMWLVASIAGWAVIAVLLLAGTNMSGGSDAGSLVDFTTAAGSPE